MVCCNCKKGNYGDPRGNEGTWFKCGCACHEHGGKYPKVKQTKFEKKHPETNEKVVDFPEWFKKDKSEKVATKKANRE